ncbi:MAG: GMC family oxidoreductase [Parafilimonas terrae]|nr:GMC family oxidoreductase [Parafilimonas terrae]
MTKRLPKKDVVVVGLGWCGSILAHEMAEAGLDVVAIDRGPWRDTATDFNIGYAQDELRYVHRHELMLSAAEETYTFRNDARQTALPMREYGSFLLGTGTGGSGAHWAGLTWRYHPTDFRLRSHLAERYGAAAIPDDLWVRDWGVTYEELEPYFDRFEYVAGIAGRAGVLNGAVQPGGNPFEGSRSRPYPLPPMKMSLAPTMFAEATREMGYSPFPTPSANATEAYTNPLGVTMGPCTYCGFCSRCGCANYAKASPQTTILPALMRKPNFTARMRSEVLKVELDASGKRATGVTFVDETGAVFEQPADLVLLAAFTLPNVRLLFLSGIGQPYDPVAGEGLVGRNYAYQTNSAVQLFFDDKRFNAFASAGGLGQGIDEFNGDNFDHGGLGFFGGASVMSNVTSAWPIGNRMTPPGTPRWGAAWKQATAKHFLSTTVVRTQGSSYPSRGNCLDVDPTYTDNHGRPMMRLTFDFTPNDLRMSAYVTEKASAISRAMGPNQMHTAPARGSYDIVPFQSTHNTGGAIMGSDPKSSVVNRYLQSWDVPNLFVVGASAFPQNAGYNPTGTVGALAYWTADAIRRSYLKNPGPLVPA